MAFIRDDVTWSDWMAVRSRAHGDTTAGVARLSLEISDWPDAARLVSSAPEEQVDDWWIEGWAPRPQPWLSLVRSLWTPAEEIADLEADSAWVREGLPGVTTWFVDQPLAADLTAQCRSMLSSLTTINLASFASSADRLEAWVGSLAPIERLVLGGLSVRIRVIDGLRDAHAQTLRGLSFDRSYIGLTGLRRLSRWPTGTLQHLALRDGSVQLRTFDRVELPLLGSLESLDLNGANACARHYTWLDAPQLRQLSMCRIALGDSAPRLFEEAALPRLRTLRLASTRLTPTGLVALANAPWSHALTHVDVRANSLPDEALPILESIPADGWRQVLLSGNHFTATALAGFVDRQDLRLVRPGVYSKGVFR